MHVMGQIRQWLGLTEPPLTDSEREDDALEDHEGIEIAGKEGNVQAPVDLEPEGQEDDS